MKIHYSFMQKDKQYLAIKYVFIIIGLSLMIIFLSSCEMLSKATPTPTQVVESTSYEPINKQVAAEGELVPVKYAELAFSISGIVEEIFVDEGEKVKAGDVIARLRGSEIIDAQIATAELAQISAQQSLDDIYSNASLCQAQAKLTLVQAEEAYDDAIESREDMNHKVGDANLIELAFVDYILAQNRVDDLEREYESVSHLIDDNEDHAEKLSALEQARVLRDQALKKYNYLKSNPDSFMIGESQGDLQVAKANLDKAKLDWERLNDGIDDDELALAQTRLFGANSQLEAAKSAETDLELRAPFDGVVATNTLEIGELAVVSLPYVSVADYTSWKIETSDLTELDVLSLQPGLPASISIDALPGEEFTGEIESIQEIGFDRQNDVTYKILIDLLENDERIRWKMTAFVIFEVK